MHKQERPSSLEPVFVFSVLAYCSNKWFILRYQEHNDLSWLYTNENIIMNIIYYW